MKKSLALVIFLLSTLGVNVPSWAESIAVPVGQQGQQSMNTPHKGMNGAQVINQYGEPNERKRAIGEPPIVRWKYDGYTVYFENDYVIHSVRHPLKQ